MKETKPKRITYRVYDSALESYYFTNGSTLQKDLHYFQYGDLSHKHENERLFVALHGKKLVGIIPVKFYEMENQLAVPYISVNEKYRNLGICSNLIKLLFETYNNSKEDIHFSGYTILGWLYVHPLIKRLRKQYNVSIKEKPIEYILQWDDFTRDLYDKSRLEILS